MEEDHAIVVATHDTESEKSTRSAPIRTNKVTMSVY